MTLRFSAPPSVLNSFLASAYNFFFVALASSTSAMMTAGMKTYKVMMKALRAHSFFEVMGVFQVFHPRTIVGRYNAVLMQLTVTGTKIDTKKIMATIQGKLAIVSAP